MRDGKVEDIPIGPICHQLESLHLHSFLDHQRLSRVVIFLMQVTTNGSTSTTLVSAPDGSAKHNGRHVESERLDVLPMQEKGESRDGHRRSSHGEQVSVRAAAQNQLMHELDESVPCLAGCLDLVDLLSGCVKDCRVVSIVKGGKCEMDPPDSPEQCLERAPCLS